MVPSQLDCFIQFNRSTSQNDVTSSSNPLLFGLFDLFLSCTVFKIKSSFPKFWFFLLSQLNPKVRTEKRVSDSELTHQPSLILRDDDGALGRDEVEMVMGSLGLLCSSGSEELGEKYDLSEVSGVFEEEEPSLEELKQAFDVFDVNKDGFIDERELQRVLCVLGFNEAATERENCQKMIRNFDANGDGRIDFKEFVKIMENSFC
ncbi:hypothetical protein QN277_011177 [Acacia crassicarpa]|uniref:EF-hand domain-containing protein n=1 Tax=Acacia crassicarpa TaxID=499986 RepID=A0AAE1MYC2_9FABA|nr:hypothetical protein QN277_011177 [Acacia crassicarpa]